MNFLDTDSATFKITSGEIYLVQGIIAVDENSDVVKLQVNTKSAKTSFLTYSPVAVVWVNTAFICLSARGQAGLMDQGVVGKCFRQTTAHAAYP